MAARAQQTQSYTFPTQNWQTPNQGGSPSNAFDKGFFADQAALLLAYPNGIPVPTDRDGRFVRLGSTDTVWIRDSGTNAWVNSDISINQATQAETDAGIVAGKYVAPNTLNINNAPSLTLPLVGTDVFYVNRGNNRFKMPYSVIQPALFGVNTAYLDPINGSNATAQINNPNKAYSTIIGAVAALPTGGNIVIAPGSIINSGPLNASVSLNITCLGGVTIGNFVMNVSILNISCTAGTSTFNASFSGNSFTIDKFNLFNPLTGGWFSTSFNTIAIRNCNTVLRTGLGMVFSGSSSIVVENCGAVQLGGLRYTAIGTNLAISYRNCLSVNHITVGGLSGNMEVDGGVYRYTNIERITFTGPCTAFSVASAITPTFEFNDCPSITSGSPLINAPFGVPKVYTLKVRNAGMRFGTAATQLFGVNNNCTIDVAFNRRVNTSYSAGTITTINNTPDIIVTTL